jgi:hypothetical protein
VTDPLTPSSTRSREVDRYCDALLLALRMRELPGDRIGSVLTEVRAHLADSGEDPVETFGTPEDYAEVLTAERPARSRQDRIREGLTGAAFLLGVCWLLEGAIALATGAAATLGPTPPVAAALAAAGAPWVLEQLVSSSRARVVRGVVAFVLAATVLGGLGVLVDGIGLGVPTLVPVLLGVAALVAGTLGLHRTVDPVISPFDDAGNVQARRRRSGLLLTAVLWGQLLVLMAVVVLMAVLVGAGG